MRKLLPVCGIMLSAIAVVLLMTPSTVVTAQEANAVQNGLPNGAASPLDEYLSRGELEEAEQAFTEAVEEDGEDADALFSLGAVQYLQAYEQLGQALYAHGFGLPVPPQQQAQSPFPDNPNPQPISYVEYRQISETFLENLGQALTTLERVDDQPVSVLVRLAEIRLDVTGDGEPDVSVRDMCKPMGHGDGLDAGDDLLTELTTADAYWLVSLAHMAMAQTEFYLAHDAQEMFDRTAFVFFPKVDSPYAVLRAEPQGEQDWEAYGYMMTDIVAMVHLVQWEVVEPQRMGQALAHLRGLVAACRSGLEIAQQQGQIRPEEPLQVRADDAEADEQGAQPVALQGATRGMIGHAKVTADKVPHWERALTTAEDVLAGRKLLPFPRVEDRGINVPRVFNEPRKFDLILWIQGSAALPYLEEGPIAEPWWEHDGEDVEQERPQEPPLQ